MTSGELLGAAQLVIAAALFFWMYRDARARDAHPILWIVAIFAASFLIHRVFLLVGTAVYLIARPKGRLERCPHCRAPYLDWLARCPKCRGPVMKDCHRCGAAIPYVATACPECGGLTS